MLNVMLDLETMGTDPYSPIIAIGACSFGMNDLDITDHFYIPISLESCMEIGLRPNASTICWWMQQSEEARALIIDPAAVKLPIALDAFTDWLNSRPMRIWGNSAAFDCGLLSAAYKACSKERPWAFWDERCYRTIKNMVPNIKLSRVGIHHHALDDALSQAYHLQKLYKQLQLA